MAYFSAADGPVISKSGVGQASYGFVMPIFSGGGATWNDVSADVGVKVKVSGNWVDIDSVSGFLYNQNWGHWSDSGTNGYWFILSETTEIQLYSKANSGVALNYTLQFQNINTTTITSMTPTQGPQLTAGFTGGDSRRLSGPFYFRQHPSRTGTHGPPPTYNVQLTFLRARTKVCEMKQQRLLHPRFCQYSMGVYEGWDCSLRLLCSLNS